MRWRRCERERERERRTHTHTHTRPPHPTPPVSFSCSSKQRAPRCVCASIPFFYNTRVLTKKRDSIVFCASVARGREKKKDTRASRRLSLSRPARAVWLCVADGIFGDTATTRDVGKGRPSKENTHTHLTRRRRRHRFPTAADVVAVSPPPSCSVVLGRLADGLAGERLLGHLHAGGGLGGS